MIHTSYFYGFAKIVSVPSLILLLALRRRIGQVCPAAPSVVVQKRVLGLGFTYNRVFPKTGVRAPVRVWAVGVNPQCVGPYIFILQPISLECTEKG